MTWKANFRGREVTRPIIRFALFVALVFIGAIAIPFALPGHFILRLCGRRGLFRRDSEGMPEYVIDGSSFERRAPQ